MRFNKILLIVLILVFIFIDINLASADDVTITRDIQKEIQYGNDLRITLSITNNLNAKKTFELRERLPLNVDLIDPKEPSERRMFNAVEVLFLKWTITLEPAEKKTVSYTIKPNKVGDYAIVGAEALNPETETTYNGLQSQFDVTCNKDNICNLEIGENYQTCPSDCSTGLQDGICNAILDNQCDLDCTKDPDCKGKGFNLLYIVIPIVLIAIIIMLIYFFKKPKQGIPEQEQKKQDQQPQQPKQPESILYS